MPLCRECDVVLWRDHESCPCCRARRPGVRLREVHPAAGGRVRLAVAVAATAPAVDLVLRVLLG